MSFALSRQINTGFYVISSPHPHPFFFGPDDARLFGCFHPATGRHGVRQCAVVLCQPIGHEYMYAYRAFRQLAERLSKDGFPVLRFDYFGTGNSTGESYGPQQVDAWRTSLAVAVAELRRRTGNVPIVLVGLRLGATLATLEAAGQAVGPEPIDAVVLWDPCVAGKTYIRQIRMLAAATAVESVGPLAGGESAGYLEALGYVFTPEMITRLQSIDLLNLHPPAFPRTLLIARDGNMPQDNLAKHLESLGAEVTRQTYDEYDTFLVTAERSILPTTAMRMITEWLERTYPIVAPTDASRSDVSVKHKREGDGTLGEPESVPEHLLDENIEIPVHIDRRLFGIVTTPPTVDTQKPAIVFLNMGTDHHVGPRRIYVQFARTIASSCGMVVIRVDLSGIGDTASTPDSKGNDPYPTAAMADIDAIITYLRRTHGIRRVMLAGMCAGGYHAIHGARANEAVVGIISINAPLYAKPGQSLDINPFEEIDDADRLREAMFSPATWARLARGGIAPRRVLQVAKRAFGLISERTASIFRASSRSTERGEDDIEMSEWDRLFSPEIDTHLIYDGSDLGYRYLQHIGTDILDRWQAMPTFTLSVVTGGSYVFIPLAGQAILNDLVLGRLIERYGDVTPPDAPMMSQRKETVAS